MAQASGWVGRLLRQVRVGMAVYDRHHALVGTVAAVYLSDDARAAVAAVPAAARRGLLAKGFVEIEAGPRAPRRYASGGQLAAVDGERVLLNVGGDYLATH